MKIDKFALKYAVTASPIENYDFAGRSPNTPLFNHVKSIFSNNAKQNKPHDVQYFNSWITEKKNRLPADSLIYIFFVFFLFIFFLNKQPLITCMIEQISLDYYPNRFVLLYKINSLARGTRNDSTASIIRTELNQMVNQPSILVSWK